MTTFIPQKSGLEAIFDQIYEVKFSRHVPLTVVLLSGIYAVYRSHHYLTSAFKLSPYVAGPTALFLELLVLGASAVTFIAFREAYVTELKKEDQELSKWGIRLALTALIIAFVALLGIAWADAWAVTKDWLASILMTLVQFVQAAFILSFIVNALLDERETLREEFKEYELQRALACPYCGLTVSNKNRKRHMESCPLNPKSAT